MRPKRPKMMCYDVAQDDVLGGSIDGTIGIGINVAIDGANENILLYLILDPNVMYLTITRA